MQELEAINYLEKLEVGNFLTVNFPVTSTASIPITAMYVGKDKEGRYNFKDNGEFILSKEFIEKGKITIDEKYDGDVAIDIYAKLKLQLEKQQRKKKNRDVR